eukprot:scaffold294447_cov36-Tisochrysis_lutea.AAC.2
MLDETHQARVSQGRAQLECLRSAYLKSMAVDSASFTRGFTVVPEPMEMETAPFASIASVMSSSIRATM